MFSKSYIALDDEPAIFDLAGPSLTPAQQNLAEAVRAGSRFGDLTVVHILPGMGRTTVLKAIHSRMGGIFVGLRQLLSSTMQCASDSLPVAAAAFSKLIGGQSTVLVDDGHLLAGCGMTPMLDQISGDRRVVVACDESAIRVTKQIATDIRMQNFSSEDYAGIVRYYLGDASEYLDMSEVFRYSANLTVSELKHASLWLGLRYEKPDTKAMIRYLAALSRLKTKSPFKTRVSYPSGLSDGVRLGVNRKQT